MDLDDGALARSLTDLTELSELLGVDTVTGPLSSQLAVVVSAAAELLGADSVGLLLLDDTDRPRAVAATGRAAERLERAQEEVAVGPGVDALTDRATVAVADLAAEPRYGALWQEVAGQGIRAVLAAPIRLDGQVVGNLNALVPDPHNWSATERRSAEVLADIVGQLLGLAAAGASPATRRNGREPVR
jgi:GAF domain-containing protein